MIFRVAKKHKNHLNSIKMQEKPLNGLHVAFLRLHVFWISRQTNMNSYLEMVLFLTNKWIIRHWEVKSLICINPVVYICTEIKHTKLKEQ